MRWYLAVGVRWILDRSWKGASLMTYIDNAPEGPLSKEIVKNLLKSTWRVKDIAQTYSVSSQYVSMLKHADEEPTPIDLAIAEFWPWNVPTRFHGTTPQYNCRYHIKYRVDRDAINAKQRRLLAGFYNRLISHGLVVEFDPNIPPHPGVWKGGFTYREREERDRDLIFRVNEHVVRDMDDRMYEMWRIPPQEAWPS